MFTSTSHLSLALNFEPHVTDHDIRAISCLRNILCRISDSNAACHLSDVGISPFPKSLLKTAEKKPRQKVLPYSVEYRMSKISAMQYVETLIVVWFNQISSCYDYTVFDTSHLQILE